LLNSNLHLACESLQNIWNAKMLELSFPFSRFADRNIEIFQSPFRHFSGLRMTGVDSPYNNDPTVKTSGLRGVYNKFHTHFWY
jgi:hypothetical protein